MSLNAFLRATLVTSLVALGCFTLFWLLLHFAEQTLFAIFAGLFAIFWGVMYDHFR